MNDVVIRGGRLIDDSPSPERNADADRKLMAAIRAERIAGCKVEAPKPWGWTLQRSALKDYHFKALLRVAGGKGRETHGRRALTYIALLDKGLISGYTVSAGSSPSKTTIHDMQTAPPGEALLEARAHQLARQMGDWGIMTGDEYGSPFEVAVHGQLVAAVDECVRTVGERYGERAKDVLRRRFGLRGDPPQTLTEIGEVHGIHRERVRQIEGFVIRKIRQKTPFHYLREFEV